MTYGQAAMIEELLEFGTLISPVGNTGDISQSGDGLPVVRRLQAGVDQIEIRLDLAGSGSIKHLDKWETAPASKGRVRLGRKGEFNKWEPMLGHTVLWRADTSTLWIDIHPFADARLLPLDCLQGEVKQVLEKFAFLGVVSYEPIHVSRVDVTADLLFADPVDGRQWMLALSSARGPHGRRMRPYNHDLETVYVETRGGKKLGVIYDKGTERKYHALGRNRWIRMEARQFWNGADAPRLEDLTSGALKAIWADRFMTLGGGRTVKPEGVVMTVGELLRNGEISVRDGEKLIAYLQLERAGLAQDAYGDKALAERRRLARKYGVRIDEDEREIDVDLRAVLAEYADQF